MEYDRSTVGFSAGQRRSYHAGEYQLDVAVFRIQRQRLHHCEHVVTGTWILGEDDNDGSECAVANDGAGGTAEGRTGRSRVGRNEPVDCAGCARWKPDVVSRQ